MKHSSATARPANPLAAVSPFAPLGLTPSDVRQQQLNAEADQIAAAEKTREGNATDRAGGAIAAAYGIHLFGNPRSDAYKASQSATNTLSYIPSPGTVARLAERGAVKIGARRLGLGITDHESEAIAKRAAEKGIRLRNGHLAGGVHPGTGVPFRRSGFPDFNRHADQAARDLGKPTTVRVEGITGNRPKDFELANKAAGFARTPKGYTWHHVEDCKTHAARAPQAPPEDGAHRVRESAGEGRRNPMRRAVEDGC